MTKLEKLRDQEAKSELFEYHGCLTGDCPHEATRGCLVELYKRGWDKRDAIAQDHTAKLVDLICELENYLNHRTDDLVGDDCIGDKKLTMRFESLLSKINITLADHKRMNEVEL